MPRQPGSKAIVIYQGKILLILRDNIPTIAYPNIWNTPGGGIEDGESPKEAMCRELEEEICLWPSIIFELGTNTYTDGSVVHRFLVSVTDEEFSTIRLGNEGQKIGWFTYDEMMQLDLSPHSRVYYAKHEMTLRQMLGGETQFPIVHAVLEAI